MADNPKIKQITLPNSTTYDLVDQGARDLIAALNSFTYKLCTAANDTPSGVTWTSGSTTITGSLAAASTTMNVIYLVPVTRNSKTIYNEYITIDKGSGSPRYQWEMFGDTDIHLSDFGALAYKNSASGTYQKVSTISVSTNATTNKTAAVTGSAVPNGGTANYTPAGSISFTNSNKTAAVTGSAVPSGSTANYTPAGSISVKTAGSSTTIHNPTAVTVAKTVVAQAPSSSSHPNNNLTYYSVANEVLSLYQLGYTTGDSITTSDVTGVRTGDAAYQFSGTGTMLTTGNISVPTSASFTGTGTMLTSGNIPVPSSYTATPSFENATVTVS